MWSQIRQALESDDIVERLRAIRRYTQSYNGAEFPPPPTQTPQYAGPLLSDWVLESDEIVVGPQV
jgi:hypothetical protein